MDELIEEDQVNGDKLRQAREARGWDWLQVARLSSLSLAQVKALESGGTDCFYSTSIRNNAALKVALVLGVSDVLKPLASRSPGLQQTTSTPALATDTAPAPRDLRPAVQWSSWLSYGTLSLLFVAVMGWSALQVKPMSTDLMRVQAVAPAPDPQTTSAPAENVAAVAAASADTSAQSSLPSGATTGPTTIAPTPPVVVPVAVNKPPQEVEIGLASMAAAGGARCSFEGATEALEAVNPTKSAEKISLMFHKAGPLCVQDASGKVWQEELKPWTGRTFVGKAPWKLHSPVLPNADVYFQGEKMKLTSANARTIELNGKEFQ